MASKLLISHCVGHRSQSSTYFIMWQFRYHSQLCSSLSWESALTQLRSLHEFILFRVLLTYSLSESPEIFLLSVTTPLETILNVVSREDTTYRIEKSEIICQSVDN